MAQYVAGFVQDLAEWHRDKLQVRIDAVALRGWERREREFITEKPK